MATDWLEQLRKGTEAEGRGLQEHPELQRAYRGEITRNEYAYFLWQSSFHMSAALQAFAAGASRLDAAHGEAARYFLYHAQDEWGEDQWCLNDLKAMGAREDRSGYPERSPAVQAFIAYLFYLAERGNPLALLADSYVVEGVAMEIGAPVASRLKERLGLPDAALTYLGRHGEIDVKHYQEFAALLEQAVQGEGDFRELLHAARTLFWLYTEFLLDAVRAGDREGTRILG